MAKMFYLILVIFALLFFLTPLMESTESQYLPYVDVTYIPLLAGLFFIVALYFIFKDR